MTIQRANPFDQVLGNGGSRTQRLRWRRLTRGVVGSASAVEVIQTENGLDGVV